MVTVARIMGKRLKDAGIDCVFGVPGGEVLDLLEGFREEGIQFFLTRHETEAAFMAESYGCLTGKPGVCIGTLAPGATNLVTGVSQAYLDRAPLIAISGQLPVERLTTTTHQALNTLEVFQPITKWSQRVTSNNAWECVDKAIRCATSSYPGPVYLEIPSDVPKSEFCGRTLPYHRMQSKSVFAEQNQLQIAADVLGSAKKPLILAGLGAARACVGREVLALASKLNIPIMVTPKIKGLIAEDHPLFLGTIEMLGTNYLYKLIEESDLLVGIGFDAVELDRPWPADHVPMLHIDEFYNTNRYFPSDWDFAGCIKEIVRGITTLVEPRQLWADEEVTEAKRHLCELVHPSVEGLCPHHVIEAIRQVAPRNSYMASDVGAHKMAVGQLWQALEPKHFQMSNGLSSMGYGIPAAMAAKMIFPEAPSFAVIGDGGLGMFMGELETAVRYKLPIIVTVMSDRTLSLIEIGHQRRGYNPFGVYFNEIDYMALASAMHLKGMVLDDPADCINVYQEALDSDIPVLIEARINPAAYRV